MTTKLGAGRRAGLGLFALGMCAVAVALGGCAETPSSRVALRGEEVDVQVRGQGIVRSSLGIDCGTGDDHRGDKCHAAWMDLSTHSLRAEAAPGWRLDHWEWEAEHAELAPGYRGEGSNAYVYRAVFTRAPASAAGLSAAR